MLLKLGQHALVFTEHNFLDFFKKLDGLYLWIGFNCLQAAEPLQGNSLRLLTKSSRVSGTHLINHGYIRG